jgi:hypothetical protein
VIFEWHFNPTIVDVHYYHFIFSVSLKNLIFILFHLILFHYFYFVSVGVDGKRYTTSSTKPSEICLLCCCPCFAGDICGEDRKTQYKRCFMTFCFFITIVQLIMLIIEVSIGGFDFKTPNYFLGPDGKCNVLFVALLPFFFISIFTLLFSFC